LSITCSQKKLIGICFGHQLIAKALGGKVIRSPKGWGVGLSLNSITGRTEWMVPALDIINLPVSHSEQVVEPPLHATLLASTEFCPYFMLQIGEHILTVQGHPEFSKNYTKDLMEMRKDALSDESYQQGLSSLALASDGEIMARWTGRFLRKTT
jgi:GMP synthase-like glutamine amidotransferase